ncbi:MAG: hypothetical protein H6743_03915 [Rickettsiaceae bacterium]|nr:hypothetical protein [Rickettsiaceae bacterium]
MQRQKQLSTHLTIPTINRVLVWGKHLMSDPEFRWTKTDTETMGKLADEIRRIKHQEYLLSKKTYKMRKS